MGEQLLHTHTHTHPLELLLNGKVVAQVKFIIANKTTLIQFLADLTPDGESLL